MYIDIIGFLSFKIYCSRNSCWFIRIFHLYSQSISRIRFIAMSIVLMLLLVPGFTQLTTALFVTSVSAVHVVVTSILHFDTIPCAVTGEFVVLADSAVFARAMELAVYTGTVKIRKGVTSWSHFDYIAQWKLMNNSLDIMNFLPVQTILDDGSAFGPFLTIVETWAVLGQNASLICGRTNSFKNIHKGKLNTNLLTNF